LPKPLTVQVDFPGYHLHGEVLEARRTFLHTKSNIALDVYLVKDPDTGEEFGIPINRAVLMKDPPVIDLRGRLHDVG